MTRRRLPQNVRAVMAAIHDAGFAPAVTRGKHFKLEWRDWNGRRHVLTVSASPSDQYAEAAALRDVKRVVRQIAPTSTSEVRAGNG